MAGYPVQPADGKAVDSLTVSFLVYYEPKESSPRVFVSTTADTAYGSLAFSSGYEGSCIPVTPFGEPNKFSCAGKLEEGTYYWQFAFKSYECETIYGYPFCSYKDKFGPVWKFTVKLPPSPEAVLLPIRRGPSTASRQDPLYSNIASAISKKPAVVRCWSFADWNLIHVNFREHEGAGDDGGLRWVLGYVMFGTKIVNLAPEICRRLDLVAYGRQRPRALKAKLEIGEAVDTLAHEAIHVYGIRDEAVTECSSMQLTELTATKLGTTFGYGRELGQLLWRYRWPLTQGTEYYTDECYNGGPLDLYPNERVWP